MATSVGCAAAARSSRGSRQSITLRVSCGPDRRWKRSMGQCTPDSTAADISEARRNWAKQLDETTARYRNLRLMMKTKPWP